jgi:hypothetical protein
MMAKQGTPKAAVAKQAAFYARAADLAAQTQRELDRVTRLSTSSRVAHRVGGTRLCGGSPADSRSDASRRRHFASHERPVVLRGLAAGGRLLLRPGRVR